MLNCCNDMRSTEITDQNNIVKIKTEVLSRNIRFTFGKISGDVSIRGPMANGGTRPPQLDINFKTDM